MHRINISVRHLVNALNGKRPLNKPVGYAKNEYGQFMVAFVATEPAEVEVKGPGGTTVKVPNPRHGEPIWVGEGEDARVTLNIKLSKRQDG